MATRHRLRRVFAQGPLLLSLSFLSDGWEDERVLHYVRLPLLPPNCEGKHQLPVFLGALEILKN